MAASRIVWLMVGLLVVVCLGFGVSTSVVWGASERMYEQVSPVFKGGYGAKEIVGVRPDGGSVVFASFGVFVGDSAPDVFNYYRATRADDGWESLALNPPAALSPVSTSAGFSPSLDSSLWVFRLHAKNKGLASDLSNEEQFYVGSGGGFQPAGPALKAQDGQPFEFFQEGISDDFCHIFISSFNVSPLVPEAVGHEAQIYEVDACDGSTEPKLVALTNSGALLSPNCSSGIGSGSRATNAASETNAVSANGSTVYFGVNVPNSSCASTNSQLFVRLGGEKTLEVSKPLGEACTDVPCPGSGTRKSATFSGASEDGSRVFFLTSSKLDSSMDNDGMSDLYMATIGCSSSGCAPSQQIVTSLVQVSHDPTAGEAAEVQGVIGLSRDGSHVYFVAKGILSQEGPTSEGAQGEPVRGADNLYVYEINSQFPLGHVAFIGDLCTGPNLSGKTNDVRCPGDLESQNGEANLRNDASLFETFRPSAQVGGPTGEFLVFSTYAKLISQGAEADTDDAQDVYLFNTTTGSLRRVSIGEGGSDVNGNRDDERPLGLSEEFVGMYNGDARVLSPFGGGTHDEERKLIRSAINEDGSRVVFTTADALSSNASNGLPDIYEWHEGQVSLISNGSAIEADELPVITPSGNDVFFVTSAGLVPQDTDGAPDIYDARIGGGFPQPPTEPAPCAGDACQGPLTNPAPLLVPGSVAQAPGENLPAPVTKSKAKAKRPRRKAKPKRVKKKSNQAGGKAQVRKNGKGR